MPSRTPTRSRIARAIRALLDARAGKTICPSEVARALDATEWRPLMEPVRRAAGALAECGEIVVTQRGRTVDIAKARGPVRLARPARTEQKTGNGSYADAYRAIDFRKHPELYRVGRGEEGVLVAEPYRSELLPLWRFRTPEVARASAAALWSAFVRYRRARDYVGMDMARKYLQMGFTRARRYANHRSGTKYDAAGTLLPLEPDPVKAESAAVFYEAWQRAERDRIYAAWRERMRAGASRGRRPNATRTKA